MREHLMRPTTLVMVVIALGFGLRLFHLDAQSFWYDEAMSAGIARGTITQILGNDFYSPHPPLYFLTLHYWIAIGQSDFAIRLLSAILGVAGVAGMYSLGKALCDDTVGLASATIAAIAPYMIFYSQEARMYALVFLLSTMLLLSYVRMLYTDSRRWWVAYTLLATLSLFTSLRAGPQAESDGADSLSAMRCSFLPSPPGSVSSWSRHGGLLATSGSLGRVWRSSSRRRMPSL